MCDLSVGKAICVNDQGNENMTAGSEFLIEMWKVSHNIHFPVKTIRLHLRDIKRPYIQCSGVDQT